MPTAFQTRQDKPELSTVRTTAGALAIVLLLACAIWHIHIMNRWMEHRSDLLPPWVGARVALSGGNPYAQSTTDEIQRRFYGSILPADGKEKDKQAFAYPIYTVFFLAPLAWLTWPAAGFAFVLVAVPVLVACSLGWLSIFGSTLTRRRTILLIAIALTSWPIIIALRHQQLTLLAVVFLSGGCLALAHSRPLLAGAVFACAAIKPQAAALLLLWIMLRAVALRDWQLPAAFTGGVLLEFLAGFLLRPTWLREWLANVAAYHHYTGGTPSLCVLFGPRLGGAMLSAVVLLALVALWHNFHDLNQRQQLGIAASLLLAITCALLPTGLAWIYNQALLLPGGLFVAALQPRSQLARWTRRAAILCFGLNSVLLLLAVFMETIAGPNTGFDYLPYFNQCLPSAIAIAVATYALTEERAATAAFEPAMAVQRA